MHENHYLEIAVVEIPDKEISAQGEKWTKIALTRIGRRNITVFLHTLSTTRNQSEIYLNNISLKQ